MLTIDLTVKLSYFSMVSFFTASITSEAYFSVSAASLFVKIWHIDDQFAFVAAVLFKNWRTFVRNIFAKSLY